MSRRPGLCSAAGTGSRFWRRCSVPEAQMHTSRCTDAECRNRLPSAAHIESRARSRKCRAPSPVAHPGSLSHPKSRSTIPSYWCQFVRASRLAKTKQAERKKAAMRKAARARILGKRAAAAAKQVRGGGQGDGGGGGGGRRVFRRARRDCLVTDARRKKLGAYLFCGKGWLLL